MTNVRISSVLAIMKIRDKKEPKDYICIREINQNIRNVMKGKALTRPLRTLNKNCKFQKRYEIACDLMEEGKTKICMYCNKSFRKLAYWNFCSKECKDKKAISQKKTMENPERKERFKNYKRDRYRKQHNIPKENWRIKD